MQSADGTRILCSKVTIWEIVETTRSNDFFFFTKNEHIHTLFIVLCCQIETDCTHVLSALTLV